MQWKLQRMMRLSGAAELMSSQSQDDEDDGGIDKLLVVDESDFGSDPRTPEPPVSKRTEEWVKLATTSLLIVQESATALSNI